MTCGGRRASNSSPGTRRTLQPGASASMSSSGSVRNWYGPRPPDAGRPIPANCADGWKKPSSRRTEKGLRLSCWMSLLRHTRERRSKRETRQPHPDAGFSGRADGAAVGALPTGRATNGLRGLPRPATDDERLRRRNEGPRVEPRARCPLVSPFLVRYLFVRYASTSDNETRLAHRARRIHQTAGHPRGNDRCERG